MFNAKSILYEKYKTAGYSEREIPRLILKNNLYGLDIDDRAAQLASFSTKTFLSSYFQFDKKKKNVNHSRK